MSAMISQDDLKEFRQEGAELLEAAEKALLSLEDGADYKTQYNAIFRAFHNLKGAAGMMEMLDLQSHTHVLETNLVAQKEKDSLTSNQIDYFLKGVDTAKKLLWGGSAPVEEAPKSTPAPAAPTASNNNVIPMNPAASAVTPVTAVKQEPKQIMIEPTRFLLFSEGHELTELHNELKQLGLEVVNCTDYIDGITKYDSFLPHVIVISPQFGQTSPEELKSILNKDGHRQLFIDFDFTSLTTAFVLRYVRLHFENLNLNNLIEGATNLLKFHYSDMLDYLRQHEKQQQEDHLTESMRDLLRYKSTIGRKFKG